MAKITTGQMFEQWEQMNQKLEALDEKMNGIIDGTTPVPTQLTGSIVEEIKSGNTTVLNNEEQASFRDEDGRNFDLRNHRNITFVVHNRHDIEIDVELRFSVGAPSYSANFISMKERVPAGATKLLYPNDGLQLESVLPYAWFRITRRGTPSTGRFDYWYFGERR